MHLTGIALAAALIGAFVSGGVLGVFIMAAMVISGEGGDSDEEGPDGE